MLESANTRSSRVSANPSQSSEIEKALKELKKTIAGQRSAATFVAVVRSPSLGLAPVAAQVQCQPRRQ